MDQNVLSKEAILGMSDLKIERVQVPAWCGAVYLRELSAGDRILVFDRFLGEDDSSKAIKNGEARALTVTLALCDRDGNRLFTADDVELIQGKSSAVIDTLYDVAARMSGFNKSAVEDAKKNSNETQNE